MDPDGFDAFAKVIAAPAARRVVLRGLFGTLLGGVLAHLGPGQAEGARCRPLGRSCRRQPGQARPRCCSGSRCNGTACVCRPGFKRCRARCIRRNRCCTTRQCPGDQVCRRQRCGCQPGLRPCAGACIPPDACCTAAECPPDQVCTGQHLCAPAGCSINQQCASGVCACLESPEAGTCQQRGFIQPFDTNLAGWYAEENGVFAPPETGNTVTLANGGAIIGKRQGNDRVALTTWGGYSSVWPAGGFTTQIEIFLDASITAANTFFYYEVLALTTSCAYHREFGMSAGTNADGATFCVSGTTSPHLPCDATLHPYIVTASGWYRFRHDFREAAGILEVTMSLLDTSDTLLGSWVISDPNDTIGPSGVVGGNGSGSFPIQGFPQLPVRNSSRLNR